MATVSVRGIVALLPSDWIAEFISGVKVGKL
jgi:hypothetical protein